MNKDKYNYKLKITYDGSRYYGWERQPDKPTIQGKIEDVLSRFSNEKIEITGASRTDAGVHARGMVANVFLNNNVDPIELRKYLNTYLPEDIAITDVKEAADRFHSRYLAHSKIYQYTCFDGEVCPVFNRKYYTYIEEPLDVDRMSEAAKYLIGEHDFKCFCGNPKMKKSTVRNIISVDIRRSKGYIYFTYEGTGFLQYMVRIMTGTLLEVGLGKREPKDIEEIILSKDRSKAGYTAPAKGLCLLKVKYGG